MIEELEVLLLLFGFVALFSLPIVVPWIVIRLVVRGLEANAEATSDRRTSPLPEPEEERGVGMTRETGDGERRSDSDHPERPARNRGVSRDR